MSQDDEIKKSLDLIQQAVLALDKKIEAQGQRITNIEQGKNASEFVKDSAQEDVLMEIPPLPPPPNLVLGKVEKDWMNDAKRDDGFSIESTNAGNENSLEENIGGKLFMTIGITALVLGISFFLKYAFDNNWIGETGRVMIGIFIGLGLLSIGEKTIRKYAGYGQMISGAGIAVLYLSIFSAFNYYQLIDSYIAFFAMVIITAIAIVLSLRYDAIALMMVAVVGGFATPLMASSGQNNQVGLLSYVAMLDVAILTVSVFKKWRMINVAGFIGTIILFSAWAEKFYTKSDLNSTMFFLTLFFLIYSISSLIYNLVKKELSTGAEQMMVLSSAIIYFSASYGLLNANYHMFLGFFAMVLAFYYFIWAFAVRNFTPNDENLYGFLAFLTVGFVTIALPIQFKQNVITISWAIEAVLLMIIGTKLKKNALVIFSIVVSALAIFRYLVLDIAKYDKYTMAIFNSAFFTAIALIAAAYVISYVVRIFAEDENKTINKKSVIALFVIVANLIMIFSISREITASYDRDIQAIYEQQSSISNSLYGNTFANNKYNTQGVYSSSEYKTNQEKITKLQNKSSIMLSIFWLAYAIMLLIVGVAGKFKSVRLGALALLTVAIFKLFFVDLWSLGTLYRIISSISLGIVLMLVSFMYQKYKNTIKEII